MRRSGGVVTTKRRISPFGSARIVGCVTSLMTTTTAAEAQIDFRDLHAILRSIAVHVTRSEYQNWPLDGSCFRSICQKERDRKLGKCRDHLPCRRTVRKTKYLTKMLEFLASLMLTCNHPSYSSVLGSFFDFIVVRGKNIPSDRGNGA